MNVRNLALAACCIAVSGLAACSQSAPPPPPAPPPAPVAAPAPPPPPPAMPANLTPAQQKVAKVQMALNANGATLDVDGKWGSKTSAALKAFQSAHNLKPTGHMDRASAKALGL